MIKLNSSSILYIVAAIVVVVLMVVVIKQNSGPSRYDSFAQCLTEQNVKMYGAWWCPHCQNQKKLFEGAFGKVSYIECSLPGSKAMNQECKDAGIEGYPTWEFADGSRLTGERSLDELAEKSQCELPEKASQ
ncbi:hypothetical protein HYV69_02125 [Candidatus Uhrbacteria bacterium]|nr:hypothetical protein [Candidatus Uhrbacteria bacterium]